MNHLLIISIFRIGTYSEHIGTIPSSYLELKFDFEAFCELHASSARKIYTYIYI